MGSLYTGWLGVVVFGARERLMLTWAPRKSLWKRRDLSIGKGEEAVRERSDM